MFGIYIVPPTSHFDEVLGKVPTKELLGVFETEELASQELGSILMAMMESSVDLHLVYKMREQQRNICFASPIWQDVNHPDRNAFFETVHHEAIEFARQYEMTAKDYAEIVDKWQEYHIPVLVVETVPMNVVLFEPDMHPLGRADEEVMKEIRGEA